MNLADLSWPQVAAATRPVLAVALGSTEQHGPHLPLSTDTDIAVALTERLVAARADVVAAPPVAYGSSGEHSGFPGTLSIGQHALELLLIELVRSATDTFAAVILVSAHGGNAAPVQRAVAHLQQESRRVLAWYARWQGDAHAGRSETSLALALDPTRVQLHLAAPGNAAPLAELLPRLRAGGVAAVSPNGVLGDPSGASGAEGSALLDTLAADLIGEVTAWLDGRT